MAHHTDLPENCPGNSFMYQARPTQENQILDLLLERKGAGVFAYELATPKPEGLGILQYNARIYGLREKGHDIVNDRPGHFILNMNEPKLDKQELMENIERLRQEWLTATGAHKKLIEIRGKLLKKQLLETEPAEPEATPEDAEKIFNEYSV